MSVTPVFPVRGSMEWDSQLKGYIDHAGKGFDRVSFVPADVVDEGEVVALLDKRHSGVDFNSSTAGLTIYDEVDDDQWFFSDTSSWFERGGHVRHVSSNRAMVLLEDHGVFTDGEVLTRASLSGIGTTSQGGAVLRASASEDSGYIAAIREPSPGNIVLRLIRFSSGSSETLNDAPISLTADQAYYIRFRAEGADLSAKFWVDGDDEPATWTVHARDSEHESGMAGIGKLSGGYHSRWNTVVVNRGGGAA